MRDFHGLLNSMQTIGYNFGMGNGAVDGFRYSE